MIHVGIENQRCEIVFLPSPTQALEIDHVNFAILDHQVLRLEIAMNEMLMRRTKRLCHFDERFVFFKSDRAFLEEILDEVIEEIFLLPAIEIGIEGWHQFQVFRDFGEKQAVDLFQCGAVKRQAFFEWLVFHRMQIDIAEVFDQRDVVL